MRMALAPSRGRTAAPREAPMLHLLAPAVALEDGVADGGPAAGVEVGVVTVHALGSSQFSAFQRPSCSCESSEETPNNSNRARNISWKICRTHTPTWAKVRKE